MQLPLGGASEKLATQFPLKPVPDRVMDSDVALSLEQHCSQCRAIRTCTIAVALTLSCLMAGCRLVNREPIPRAVAECRQLSQRGITAMERGQWERAETLLADAVKASPTDAHARKQYAEALWHRQAWPDAITQMEKACSLASHDPATIVRMGEMYLEVGRVDDAQRLAQQALDSGPRLASAWALRAGVEQATGKLDEALGDMHRALSYQPDDQKLLLETAELYRKLNRPARALCTLQSLKETYPPGEEPRNVYYLEGLALAGLARFDDAAESFSAAIQRDPSHVDSHYRLGEIQLLAGRPAEAEQAIRHALALQPQHAASQALSQRIALTQSTAGTIR